MTTAISAPRHVPAPPNELPGAGRGAHSCPAVALAAPAARWDAVLSRARAPPGGRVVPVWMIDP